MPTLSAPCTITIVDFSQDRLSVRKLNNETLTAFLSRPQPDWVTCRWVNVNGLSWDVIQALGRHKNLHRLAIEDIMDTRNRTKAEWYVGHHIQASEYCVCLSWLTTAGSPRMLSSS
jgi:Mg2+ and Co2+ transporter CorA